MNDLTLRRRVAAVLLGISLSTPVAWAGEVRHERPGAGTKAALLALRAQLTALWDEEGSYIDPFGDHGVQPTTPAPGTRDQQEEGSFIDPNGTT